MFKASINRPSSLTLFCAILTALMSSACGGNGSDQSAQSSSQPDLFDASVAVKASTPAGALISVDVANAGVPVNVGLLGNNVQWVDNGDGLVSSSGQSQPALVKTVAEMGPTVLRYPGGSLTDTYRWRDGIGPIANRGANRDLANRLQKVVFGTDEFLQLASTLNSIPLISVNVTTGDAKEAADWVAYVNGTGSERKQRVQYWEIGNEPYLQEDNRPDLAIAPAEYARRANQTILAMKAVDPTIKVGLPLRSDKIGGVYATPYQGFNDTVLKAVTAPIDFVAVHNAYFPFAYTAASVTDQDLYSGKSVV